MKKQFVRFTSGWIPVSVLILFFIALAAGQARANLPNEIRATPEFSATTSMTVILSGKMLQKLRALPSVVDTFLHLPADLDVPFDTSNDASADGSDFTPPLKLQ